MRFKNNVVEKSFWKQVNKTYTPVQPKKAFSTHTPWLINGAGEAMC